ncbi:MAG: hypothetical protein A2359_03575 [Candidatus Moranbacteria bacterium RIFOXYB1_FULL_43_19]|nr:MAG: hypothetical protein A2359_03575 [Candidatus Moranbacteria bacterium RIFOXYB1_FULL_43_19]OGI27897.1 MAG: hypothetical protein A2184_02660 [Candidatus Moranbacteria bacterium RIFOXYA1_FULL_44_7]OGI32512.1 MAG: hypothetical protein A2420_02960 [Candidatus Moranbacteria bacterium RIFOXYC1_FULL_44_13]OGI38134.1 MAG: hypothetical protein A2612_01245 [Candidatus Moranbacteria bacterium RIFOXYD1_FULL_44_12]
MKFFAKHKYDISIVLAFLLFIVFLIIFRDKFGILSDRESFEQLIRSFGIFAPFAIIIAIIIEVVLAPLPGFIPAISAGFIFGAFYGSLYTYTGNVLGSFLVFWLSRKFGRAIAERLFGGEKLKKYEDLISRRENFLLFLYIFPIFPIDIISGAFGLSGISFKKFALAVSIGFVTHVLVLNLFGDWLARIFFMI